ncbi:MAG: restriction endonuclease subunit S, partial [Rhodoferax sp.]|nr:restriction endonuclease subunit S [Rhodoferax sp.]
MTTDIPAGYKLTEVGVIPGDWDVVALGDLGLCLIGLNYKPSNVKQHGTLVLRSSNVQDGVIALDDCVYVDAEIPERIRVQDGDILICVRNGSRALIGKCTVLDQRVVGQTFGAFMSVFRTSDSAFIFQQFNSNLIKRQINENIGATINQITNANLNAFLVPLPRDQGDRNAIATALSDVDALLARLDALIAKKRDLKQAAMQQLLTGQTRLPGFSSAWEMKQFSEICHMKSGEG